jgi:hypothetical protein
MRPCPTSRRRSLTDAAPIGGKSSGLSGTLVGIDRRALRSAVDR